MARENWEKSIKEIAVFGLGAIVGGYAERVTANFIRSRLVSLIVGLIIALIGAYMEGDLGDFLIGVGMPYIAQLGENFNLKL